MFDVRLFPVLGAASERRYKCLMTTTDVSINSVSAPARSALDMLPLLEFAGDLRSQPFVFEDEIPSDESLALADLRALTRCARVVSLLPPKINRRGAGAERAARS